MYDVSFRIAALRVLDFFKSMRRTAAAVGVSVASLSRWSKQLQPRQRTCNKITIAETIRSFVETVLHKTPSFTCTELCNRIRQSLNLTVSRSLVSTVVHKLNFSRKRLKVRGLPADKDRHAATCATFLDRVSELFESKRPMTSIDESGFDHRAKLLYGYAPKGKEAIVSYNYIGDRSRHNLLMAVGNDGSRSHCVHTGRVTTNEFCHFVRSLPFPKGTVLLLDNAAIHKTKQACKAFDEAGYEPLFLPPYSPQYNPIELVFGRVKNAYYRKRLYDFMSKDGIPRVVNDLVERLCLPEFVIRCFEHVKSIVKSDLGMEKKNIKV